MRLHKFLILITFFIIVFSKSSVAIDYNPNPYDIENLRFNLIPSFKLNDLNNKVINSQSLYGKDLIINFWATWSPISKTDILRLYESIKDREIQLLSICIDRDIEKGQKFVNNLKARNIIFAFDKNGEIAKKEFKVYMVPTSLYINNKGIIEEIFFGIQDWSKIIR